MAHSIAEKFTNRCSALAAGLNSPPEGLSTPQPTAIITVAGVHEDGIKAAVPDEAVLWLGPHKWWVVSENQPPQELTEKLTRALETENAALTDVSHGGFRFRMRGPEVRDVLSAGVSLDLHPSAFKPGRSVPCAWDDIYIVLHRVEEECFDVYTLRSYASSLGEWLVASYT
ncbi:Sarcosine oxidase gamma subunit [Nitrosococcus halophilus Nc 4]|uniref:Sarcosine oxidase gamma subunit n=1 Tax=Nitrosococcus halophilus (strain Nc4) TaxID=472759 RepID=D5C1G0_NITHN|nr:sarcosine oxidase subunit gamma family protein [Nitrosococcus halophilus]ADE16512.1 Sarcosine oxidase gamma subunit [Nitrosococcus halophilus Nc 4]